MTGKRRRAEQQTRVGGAMRLISNAHNPSVKSVTLSSRDLLDGEGSTSARTTGYQAALAAKGCAGSTPAVFPQRGGASWPCLIRESGSARGRLRSCSDTTDRPEDTAISPFGIASPLGPGRTTVGTRQTIPPLGPADRVARRCQRAAFHDRIEAMMACGARDQQARVLRRTEASVVTLRGQRSPGSSDCGRDGIVSRTFSRM